MQLSVRVQYPLPNGCEIFELLLPLRCMKNSIWNRNQRTTTAIATSTETKPHIIILIHSYFIQFSYTIEIGWDQFQFQKLLLFTLIANRYSDTVFYTKHHALAYCIFAHLYRSILVAFFLLYCSSVCLGFISGVCVYGRNHTHEIHADRSTWFPISFCLIHLFGWLYQFVSYSVDLCAVAFGILSIWKSWTHLNDFMFISVIFETVKTFNAKMHTLHINADTWCCDRCVCVCVL